MLWLRSTWGMRVLAVLLGISLTPVVTAPLARAMQPSRAPFYADWLRDQLEEDAPSAVQAAVDEAAAGRARSIEAFLVDFIEAFEAQQPEVQLTDVFPLEQASREALLRYLYSRYGQTLGGVPAATAALESASRSLAGTAGRSVAVLPRPDPAAVAPHAYAPALTLESRHLVFPVRLSWAARPLGP